MSEISDSNIAKITSNDLSNKLTNLNLILRSIVKYYNENHFIKYQKGRLEIAMIN